MTSPPEREYLPSQRGRSGPCPRAVKVGNGRECVRPEKGVRTERSGGSRPQETLEQGGLLSPQDKNHIRTCPSYVIRTPAARPLPPNSLPSNLF